MRLGRALGKSPIEIMDMDAAEVTNLLALMRLADTARVRRVMASVDELAADSKGMCAAHWLLPAILEGLNG